MSDDIDDGDVGYGRPPKKSQFQKGRSGNPSGKRKRPQANSVTFDDEVAAELSKLVGPKGKRKRGSARNALAKRVVHKGVVEGDARFVKLARDADLRAAERRQATPEQGLSLDEEKIVAELLARIRGED